MSSDATASKRLAAAVVACDACLRVGGTRGVGKRTDVRGTCPQSHFGWREQLEEWMNHVGAIPGFMGQLAKDWLLGWGMDISQLADDRDARNLSSYRPTSYTTGRPETAAVVSQFVSALWRLCEPTQQNPFSRLDRILVRASLHRAFKAANGYTPSRANKRFSRFINQQVLAGLQPAVTPGVDWSLVPHRSESGTR